MNLKDFSLLKEDNNHYTVGHPAGRKIEVAKKGLSDKAHGLIKGLKKVQNFAEGTPDGPVQDADKSGDIHPYDTLKNALSTGSSEDEYQKSMASLPQTPEEQAPGEEIVDRVPAMAAAPIPASAEIQANAARKAPINTAPDKTAANPLAAVQDEFSKAAQTAKGSIEKGIKAEAGMGAAESKAYQELIDKTSALNPQQTLAAYQAKDRALEAALANKTIDPDRYIHNMSTGSKIASGIAILLGGIGQGFGQQNLGMEQIKNSIAEDVEAQKSDQSNKMNLWKMNREMMRTDYEATLATQNQLLTIAKVKAMQAQAGAAGSMAGARMAPAIQALDNEIANRHQMQTVLSMAGQGGGTGQNTTDPATLVPYMVQDPKTQAEVLKEIKQNQAANENGQPMMAEFEKAREQNTIAGRAMHLGFAPPSIKVLNALADPLIHDNEGRINELEQQHVQALFPAPGDSEKTIVEKRDALQSFIHSKKAAPTAKAHGLNLENFASTSSDRRSSMTPQQQSYYDWARANPGPKADLVFKQLGLK